MAALKLFRTLYRGIFKTLAAASKPTTKFDNFRKLISFLLT
jgi:hypothetical protein